MIRLCRCHGRPNVLQVPSPSSSAAKGSAYTVYCQRYRSGIAPFHVIRPRNPGSEEYCCLLPAAATVDKNNALVTSTLSQINLKSLRSHTQAVGA
jgi:hypothetical protein